MEVIDIKLYTFKVEALYLRGHRHINHKQRHLKDLKASIHLK